MISAVIESLIKKYCGKFLKKFGSENISIGVTGTLKLTNIEFQTEELGRFQLPYKPIRAFAGEIIADLPFVLGGNFDISVKNMIIVFEKEEQNDVTLDPSIVNSMLQSLISVFYFAYQNPELTQAKTLSGTDLENSQRLFDRFFITMENIHFRLEEKFDSLLPAIEGSSEHMCTGLLFDKIEVRPVKPAEKSAHPELFVSSSAKNSLVVDKMIKCTRMSIYCKREDPMCNKSQAEVLTLGQVLNCHYHRESGNIMDPISYDFSFSAGFQKATQVFGPIIMDLKVDSVDFSLTDQQIFYLHRVTRTIIDHMYRIQSNAWMSFKTTSDHSIMDKKRVARMRWDMIRKSIKVDWYKYTNLLKSGSMKWRSWFEVWRLAARYVALREILMYHVGYESFTDADTGFVSYAIKESLIMNYSQHITSLSEKNETFVGKGNISEAVLKAAESLIYTQIISSNAYFALIHSAQSAGKALVINPFELSTVAIRALYALQLELDSILPFKTSAYCRILAEEKYKAKQALRQPVMYPEGIVEGGVSSSSKVQYTLLVSVIEANQMKASFGSSTVNAYVSLQASEGWHSGGPLTLTETKPCKASSASNNAFCLWGNHSSLSVNPALCQHFGVVDKYYKEANHDAGITTSINVEAFDRGMFSICYGSANLAINSIVEANQVGETNPNEYVGEVATHILKLTRAAGLFENAATAASNAAALDKGEVTTVRLLTMLVIGNEAVQNNAAGKFQAKVKEVLSERKTVLERAQKLEAQESFNSSQSSSQDDDEVFILDPSVLTVQDIQLQMRCPKLTFLLSGVYVVPATARESDSGSDLPFEANLPLLKYTCTDMSFTGSASNNPWIVKGSGSMESFNLQLMQKDPSITDDSDELPPPLLTLPRLSCAFNVSQISTMGRNIDGKLDFSCFDFNGQVSMYPFTVSINPQNLHNASASAKGRNIWKSVRALDHLWMKTATWAKGMASSAISVDGKPPLKLKPEAIIRLGDIYEAYPKHLNVVTELWCNAIYGNTTTVPDLLPKQQTRVKCIAPTRSLDLDINLQPFAHTIRPAPLEEIIEANNQASANLKPYEAPNLLFNWFGAVPATQTSHHPATPEAAWEIEKKELLKKIADLEEKNKKLAAKK